MSLQWPEGNRATCVGSAFTLGPKPTSTVWAPKRVLARDAEPELQIREVCGEPHMMIAGRDVGTEWTHGELTLSVARLPDNLRDDESGVLLGRSIAMRRLRQAIRLSAPFDLPVLVHGETGTGKELVARTLHEHSLRNSGPYVIVDCTAISETLVESELFGHAKGAFSGAVTHRAGPFEEAHGGTLFLDEIGEIPLPLQSKLLRVLESGTVRRVGENNHRRVDVRVVAASHRDLRRMVREGSFRADLYHRLAVLELESPPLRERHGDLALLLRRIVGDPLFGELSEAQWEAIETNGWEGNVRELRNFAQRAVVHGWQAGLFVDADAEPDAGDASRPPSWRPNRSTDPAEHESLAEYRARLLEEGERNYLRLALQRAGGNVTKAAKLAGITRTHFHRILRTRGVDS